MMTQPTNANGRTLNRRDFLRNSLSQGALLGCSAAASPLLTPVTWAAGPWDHRLVVIILRGGMDGLDVLRPVGDPDFATLRAPLLSSGAAGLDLTGFHQMHPALAPLLPLWRRGELGFVQAVSTPYRDKRSHFDGQDLLEAGTADMTAVGRDGWLNRMLQTVPGLSGQTAFSVGHDNMLLLRGAADVAHWSPDVALSLSPQGARLAELVMHDDPAFHDAFLEAQQLMLAGATSDGLAMDAAAADMMVEQGGMAVTSQTDGRPAGIEAIAHFTAERLREETRIAAFSIGGWDTHRRQVRGMDQALGSLVQAIEALRTDLGDVWQKTAVVAMTEFGRTARANGTDGTDHGTGGTMMFAGGALLGGRVYGDWPGLSEAALYDRRDVMPLGDVRAYAGQIMRGLFGLDRSVIETQVFPGVDLAQAPALHL